MAENEPSRARKRRVTDEPALRFTIDASKTHEEFVSLLKAAKFIRDTATFTFDRQALHAIAQTAMG